MTTDMGPGDSFRLRRVRFARHSADPTVPEMHPFGGGSMPHEHTIMEAASVHMKNRAGNHIDLYHERVAVGSW